MDQGKIDWCTAWPDRWQDVDFSECCKQHDEDYATVLSFSWWQRPYMRRKFDFKLARCVYGKFYEKGYKIPAMPVLMLFGVRTFGWLFAYKEKK